jgi:hypothetical protein
MTEQQETALAAIGTDADIDLTETGVTYRTLQAIADTEFVPKSLRRRVPAILACVLAGKELGLGPMESLQKIDVIDGRPSPSAELLVAMVYRAGHQVVPTEITPTSATAKGLRMGANGEMLEFEFTFTIEDAKRAGLAGKSNWKQYPGPMLYWRAVSQLVRIFFPDVVTAMKAYTPDELGDEAWEPPAPDGFAVAEEAEPEIVDPGDAEADHDPFEGGQPTSSESEPTTPASTPTDRTAGDEEDPGRPFEVPSGISTETGTGPEPTPNGTDEDSAPSGTDPEEEMWGEVYAIVGGGVHRTKKENVPCIERVCELMVTLEVWPDDALDRILMSWQDEDGKTKNFLNAHSAKTVKHIATWVLQKAAEDLANEGRTD